MCIRDRRNDDPQVLIEEAKDADVLMIANMPLKGEVIEALSLIHI